MALNLYTSNRLDILAGQLARIMSVPLSWPLTPEVIVVQSRGMERWLSLELARSLGICANCAFPFPNAFFSRVVVKCLPEPPDTQPFERDALAWRVMRLLPESRAAGVRSYLQDDTGLKLYQLACRVADTFDQYVIYRPDMLEAWEAGKLLRAGDAEEKWQAELWRRLAAEGRGVHRGRLLAHYLHALETEDGCAWSMPERVSIFGISVLPPYHLRFFEALARRSEVHLFLLNPCREYWGDIMTEKQAARLERRNRDEVSSLHTERGNSLLASMGLYGREFYEQLMALEAVDHEAYADGKEGCLLACIQSDILNLRDRGAGTGQKTPVAPADRSVQIHSCHSPMREAEVLCDSLLRLFEEDPSLAPHDILVMTPDLETYAPFVQAVFSASDDEARIPVRIADRSFLHAYRLYEVVLQLISLSRSRFGAPQVAQILEEPAVQRRFGISAGDLDLIKRWIRDTAIRWGKDAASRSQDDLPGFKENTWEAGLERLLLGYAMPGACLALFAGTLPCDGVEGGAAQVLGRFAGFLDALFEFSERLGGEKKLAEWAGLLQEMLARFFDPEDEDGLYTIKNAQEACTHLGRMQEISEFDRGITLDVVREHLEKAFSQKVTAAGFLTGAVTVCAMLPMRSIPFKVICLLGMNDSVFPRVARPPAFDLITAYPRPCDRSMKKDDRYLFLETLLSAQKILSISYTGQNMGDNSVLPPSTVVSELADYIAQGFTLPAEAPLVTKHRLQPFSPAYFKGEGLFSYSRKNFRCAQSIASGAMAAEAPAFIEQDLPEPDESFRAVTLDDLARFLVNPSQHLLQRRLGIYFDRGQDLLEDREPFSLGGLERYGLEQQLLEQRLAGKDPQELYPVARAQGILPHDMVGRQVYDETLAAVERFVERAAPHMAGPEPQDVQIDLPLGPFRLTGMLAAVRGGRQVLYRHARSKASDFMQAWVRHLALCAAGAGHETMLFALDKDRKPESWRFSPPEDAGAELERLLVLYWQGLHRPLPLFPRASLAFAEKLQKENGDERKALQAGLDIFEGSTFSAGDADDPYIHCCFRDAEFDAEQFIACARAVYVPMIEHREKLKEE